MDESTQASGGIINEETMNRFAKTHLLIVGAGGLGGHLANSFVRLGVKRLTLVDPDVFVTSNLNRQLFCDRGTLGKAKVTVVAEQLQRIHPDVVVKAHIAAIEDLDNACFTGVDWVVDAVDVIAVKQALERLAQRLDVPLLHGAIGGWYGQYGLIKPGSQILADVYGSAPSGLEQSLLSPTFIPAIVANLMTAEWVKAMQPNKQVQWNTLYTLDTLQQRIDILYVAQEQSRG